MYRSPDIDSYIVANPNTYELFFFGMIPFNFKVLVQQYLLASFPDSLTSLGMKLSICVQI